MNEDGILFHPYFDIFIKVIWNKVDSLVAFNMLSMYLNVVL